MSRGGPQLPRLIEWDLRCLFRDAVNRCSGIPLDKRPKVTLHTLRHTAASLMVATGVPLYDVAKILGHSTLAVTMRYAHFAPKAARSAIDRLGGALATKPKRAVDLGLLTVPLAVPRPSCAAHRPA
jgi:integrase